MAKRIEYLDIAKGIGIICVILGHFVLEESVLKRIISTFHMPLFFIISGYLYKPTEENKKFIIKKAKQLLIPYMFTGIILICLTILKNYIKNNEIEVVSNILSVFYASGLKKFEIGNIEIMPIGAIWFLPALFEALIFLNIIYKRKICPIIVLITFCIGYYSSKFIWMPFSIQAGMCALLFVYVGYLIKKYNVYSKLSGYQNYVILICMLLIWLIGIICNVRISMVQNKYTHGIISIIVACAGTYNIIMISKLIEKYNTNNYISKILKISGKNTLIILCFHLIELNIFPYNIIYRIISNELLEKIVVLTIKVVWVSIAVVVVYKIKLLSKVFGIKEDRNIINYIGE